MKRLLFALALVSLISCQKENPNKEEEVEVVVEPGTAYTFCKTTSLREFPAVEGNNIVRTFTYDDKNRVVRMDIQQGSNAAVVKNINYNTDGKIDNISSSNGQLEKFTYANGVLTGWEVLDGNGQPLKKSAFSYEGGKLQREDRYLYNAGAYAQADYLIYTWDAAGNVVSIKTHDTSGTVKTTDTYAYDESKENKQQTNTPQMNLMFMNWSNDITAFINSRHLIKEVTSKKRKLAYQINASGFITTVKTDAQANLFAFTYSCNN